MKTINSQITIMKSIFIFISLLLLMDVSTVIAQNDSLKKPVYRCNIELINPTNHIEGDIIDIEDSFLVVNKSYIKNKEKLLMDNFQLMKIPSIRIDEVSAWKKGSAGRGLLIGSLTGAFVGSLVALATYKEPPDGSWIVISKGETILGGTIFGFVSGGLIGLVIGSIRIKIPINGKQDKFDSARKQYQSYLN